jgi:2-methylisocitrate lyase-like PEP mutase family enzyme
MSSTQADKAHRFRSLHEQRTPLLIPNPWDIGSAAELTEAGVKRISFGASFHRAAMTGLINAAREAKEQGTFHYLDHTLPKPELNRLLPE